VTAIVIVVKLPEGAWLVAILIPGLVLLFLAIRRHYVRVAREVALRTSRWHPERLVHTVLVLVADLNYPSRRSLAYACSPCSNVRAVHVAESAEEGERFLARWEAEGGQGNVPLVILESPYRQIVEPLLIYIERCDQERPDDIITVVLPEYVPRHWWEHVLHNQTALRLKAALLYRPNTVVTNVPYHLGHDPIHW
jgi:hypothetical protein